MELKLISKYRSELMAIAMFWVAFYHSYFPFNNKLVNFVLTTCGYGGVSLFVFLSCYGLYYAYKKNNNYWHFIKKRLFRILPYSIPIAFIRTLVYGDNILYGLVDGFGLSMFFRHDLVYWFTFFILVLYFLTPLYLRYFNKNPHIVTIIGVFVVTLICLVKNSSEFTYIWFNLAIGFLGFYFAYLSDLNVKVKWYVMIIFFILGWLMMYYMYHYFRNDVKHIYPMFFIAPSMLMICVGIFDRCHIKTNLLKKMGAYTYQHYLIHEMVVYILYKNYMYLYVPGIGFDYQINIWAFIIAFILSVFYKKIIDLLINRKEIKNT